MDSPQDIGLMDKHKLLQIFDYLNERLAENQLEIFTKYLPMKLLGERQQNFIKYLGEDLGYDWQ